MQWWFFFFVARNTNQNSKIGLTSFTRPAAWIERKSIFFRSSNKLITKTLTDAIIPRDFKTYKAVNIFFFFLWIIIDLFLPTCSSNPRAFRSYPLIFSVKQINRICVLRTSINTQPHSNCDVNFVSLLKCQQWKKAKIVYHDSCSLRGKPREKQILLIAGVSLLTLFNNNT